MEYSFGEKDVKTKRNYKYPHEEPINKKENVITYWGKRGISKNVIDYLDIREDKFGNGVFNFYDTNDVLTMVKYRPARSVDKTNGEIKNWCQKDADTTPLLFNMNRINNSKPLLITEGETDCASAIEAGYLNTVTLTVLSGRPGSGKTSIIDQAIARTIDEGSPVFLFSKEMPERMSANWFNTIIAGRRNMVEKTSREGKRYHVVPQKTQKKMQDFYENVKLFL